jgi:hypothetical protein
LLLTTCLTRDLDSENEVPLFTVHTLREYMYDLNIINKIIAFGPAKSFCY